MFFQCMFSFLREKHVSPDTCAVDVATHMTDVLALVMRFCVCSFCLKRGATTPSSPHRVKNQIKTARRSATRTTHCNDLQQCVCATLRWTDPTCNSIKRSGAMDASAFRCVSFLLSVFLRDRFACLLLVSCWFSPGPRAFVLLRPVWFDS